MSQIGKKKAPAKEEPKKLLSKTAERSMASPERKARQASQLRMVSLGECEACHRCPRGIDALARRARVTAAKPRSAYVSQGVACAWADRPVAERGISVLQAAAA